MTTWAEDSDRLLALAALDLEEGLPPRPTLTAYAGDDGIALVGLRPFGPGELLEPLVELLTLLLPLGADRFGLAVPGRAWSLDDPIPPVVDELDLRTTVLTILQVDGHGAGEPLVDGWLVPYDVDDEGPSLGPAIDVGWPDGPDTTGLLALVRGRHEVGASGHRDLASLPVQFARCLLRGHHVVLAPEVADHLEMLTTR